jgi:putative transposase
LTDVNKLRHHGRCQRDAAPNYSHRVGIVHPHRRNRHHGTTTLFAALNVLEGTVIGECQPRHRHKEFLRFLDRIDQSVEAGLDIHLVLDNYGTHKHPEVKKWLAERSRYHVHFTPTSSSWLNQVERWFAEITRKRIRRGTFRSVRELTKAIDDYIRTYNNDPRPFTGSPAPAASFGRSTNIDEL